MWHRKINENCSQSWKSLESKSTGWSSTTEASAGTSTGSTGASAAGSAGASTAGSAGASAFSSANASGTTATAGSIKIYSMINWYVNWHPVVLNANITVLNTCKGTY